MRFINSGEVFRIANEIVYQKGFDYRYIAEGCDKPRMGQACYNFHRGSEGNITPGCIVGTIFHALGYSFEPEDRTINSQSMVMRSRNRKFAEFSERAAAILKIMQVAQDNGGTWYSAVSVASHVESSGHLNYLSDTE